jgi:hypothetical protein
MSDITALLSDIHSLFRELITTQEAILHLKKLFRVFATVTIVAYISKEEF